MIKNGNNLSKYEGRINTDNSLCDRGIKILLVRAISCLK